MKSARNFGFLPTVIVLAVVLAFGARLIYLSVQHHAAVARVTAAAVGATYVKKIEPALQNLAALAERQADSAAQIVWKTGDFGSLASVSPEPNTFWMSADDKVLGARPTEADTAGGIASEWRSAEPSRVLPQPTILGPMRLGSEWLIAIRVPVAPGNAGSAPSVKGWTVAYADLEELIADAHLARLVDAGYDFELSQIEPRSASARTFVSSSTEPLTDTVVTRIGLPAAGTTPGSYLALVLRAHTGWFPSSLLASEIALLALLAWLLTFGTHDLVHEMQRAKAAVAISRRRVHQANQQLAVEMQQRLKLQETFDHALFHDTFTGLPNRRYFMDQLDSALRELRTKRRARIAVIIVDISRFNLINHLLGHTAGDDLMVQVARRFEAISAALDGTLARWSGDQFALLLLDVASQAAALDMANLLQEQLRSPFNLRRHQLSVAATLGVTCVESGQERAEDIMREADIALSVAKRQETTKAVMYAQNMGQAADLVSLEADLHLALQKHQMLLLYQPIVDLATFKMVGAEALLRWRHPVEGLLTPDRFLRHAEEAGLMVPITRWVIEQAIDVAADWRRQLPADQKFYVSINLSPSGLRDPGLVGNIATLLRETKLPPASLKFEMTELALLGNVATARESLQRLHEMGIQLMLDDFGTGYSSLSNLQLFPFDMVKIDCPFVDKRGVFQANMSMVAAMIQLAGSLDLTSIAEIVEGEAAASSLKAMGCRFGQGYYFSEPIEANLAFKRLQAQDSFKPEDKPAELAVISPPQQDGSQTLILRRLQDPSGAEPMTSETVIVRPLEAGRAHEVIMSKREPNRQKPNRRDPAETLQVRPLRDPAETLQVRPLRDPAETLQVRPLRDPAETLQVRPLAEDTSETVMMPLELLSGRLDPDEDDDEDA